MEGLLLLQQGWVFAMAKTIFVMAKTIFAGTLEKYW